MQKEGAGMRCPSITPALLLVEKSEIRVPRRTRCSQQDPANPCFYKGKKKKRNTKSFEEMVLFLPSE